MDEMGAIGRALSLAGRRDPSRPSSLSLPQNSLGEGSGLSGSAACELRSRAGSGVPESRVHNLSRDGGGGGSKAAGGGAVPRRALQPATPP